MMIPGIPAPAFVEAAYKPLLRESKVLYVCLWPKSGIAITFRGIGCQFGSSENLYYKELLVKALLRKMQNICLLYRIFEVSALTMSRIKLTTLSLTCHGEM